MTRGVRNDPLNDSMDDPLLTVLHEALPEGADPHIHWIRYEPARADDAGGVPAMNLTTLMIPGASHTGLGFDLLARRLARLGIRCIAVNPRGKGVGADVSAWSRSIHQATTLDAVADTLAVLDHLTATQYLPPERYVILGHSYGGVVARYVAQQRRVAGLILLQAFTPRELRRVISSFVCGLLAPFVHGRIECPHPVLALLPPINFTALFTTRRRRRITLLGPRAAAADDARCAGQLCPESRKALTDTLALSRARSGPGALTEPLTNRALVIGGERDRMVPAALAEDIANELGWSGVRAEWAVLPHAPHDAFLIDTFVDPIAELIAPFCASIAVSNLAPIGDARMARPPEGALGALDVVGLGLAPVGQTDVLQFGGVESEEPTDAVS